MAAITKSEIVSLAFTRNIDTAHILDSDIDVAKKLYVTAYLDDAPDESSSFYENYVKPVIAYGVAVNIFNRIGSEISDRGVVDMITQGAQVLNQDSKRTLLNEYNNKLNQLIEIMCDNAAEVDDLEDYEAEIVSYVGNERRGAL